MKKSKDCSIINNVLLFKAPAYLKFKVVLYWQSLIISNFVVYRLVLFIISLLV